MDWFERLTGFREESYGATKAKLAIEGRHLRSVVNGKSFGIGDFEMTTLQSLRDRANAAAGPAGRLNVSIVRGDVRQMHRLPENAGALFQVASQFNALEMTGPNVRPEDGVTRYETDRTQGPACAIAAGAATIYRNYFAPVGGAVGQTEHRQLDGLSLIGQALSATLGKPVELLWSMRNGYALCEREALEAISGLLATLDAQAFDAVRGKLAIAVQSDVEVTDAANGPGPLVSQAFCSALPVAYTRVPSRYWQGFATLVLEAAYEATMWAAVLNSRRGASKTVLLTSVGGGAFGNDEDWIVGAMRRALEIFKDFDIDAKIVSYGAPSTAILGLAS